MANVAQLGATQAQSDNHGPYGGAGEGGGGTVRLDCVLTVRRLQTGLALRTWLLPRTYIIQSPFFHSVW